jgi:hypothetical protein
MLSLFAIDALDRARENAAEACGDVGTHHAALRVVAEARAGIILGAAIKCLWKRALPNITLLPTNRVPLPKNSPFLSVVRFRRGR